MFPQVLKIVNFTSLVDENKKAFVQRFIEVCGTSEPARIQRLLDISYQAAKNYLQGRLPDSYVLLSLATRSPYSINWLLTGEGEKFVARPIVDETPLTARDIRQLIRTECAEVVQSILEKREMDQKKIGSMSGRARTSKFIDDVVLPE